MTPITQLECYNTGIRNEYAIINKDARRICIAAVYGCGYRLYDLEGQWSRRIIKQIENNGVAFMGKKHHAILKAAGKII